MNSRLTGVALAFATTLTLHAPVVFSQDVLAQAVVVTATRQAQRADEVLSRVEVIDRDAINNAGAATLVDLLRSQPGVRVATTGGVGSPASVFIRGAESRHTLLLVDGLRIGSVTLGQPTLEAIPLAMIERIEILRGPASALYGSEAIGGVIQIFTRKGRSGFHPELMLGLGSQGTHQASVSLAGGTDRAHYSLTAGVDETDGFNAKRDPDYWSSPWGNSYDPDKDGFRNRFISASGALKLGVRDELGFNLYHSDGRSWYDSNDSYDAYLDKKLGSLGVHMVNHLSDIWTSTVRVGRSEDRLRNQADVGVRYVFDSTQTQFSWQHDVQLPLGTLLLAYDHVRSEVEGTTDYTVDDRTVKSLTVGWSASLDAHSVQLNVRHDDNSQFGGETTGLLGYGYQLTDQWSVQGSIATAFNAPTFNQLYFPDSGFGGGNPGLKPEKALNRELGVRWESGVQALELTYFNNRVTDLIAGWPPENVNKARLEGVELMYRTRLAGFDLQAGFDLLKAEDRLTGKRLQRRARESGFVRASRRSGDWHYGLEWSGQGARYEDAGNAVEMGGFGVLDAFANYRFAPDWRVEARVTNVFDKQYELARGYATPGAAVFVGVRYSPGL